MVFLWWDFLPVAVVAQARQCCMKAENRKFFVLLELVGGSVSAVRHSASAVLNRWKGLHHKISFGQLCSIYFNPII